MTSFPFPGDPPHLSLAEEGRFDKCCKLTGIKEKLKKDKGKIPGADVIGGDLITDAVVKDVLI